MGNVTQIGFQLDDESLAELDELATREAHSRAEMLREAVRQFLTQRREKDIDARLATGYGDMPPGPIEHQLAEIAIKGLGDSQLDW